MLARKPQGLVLAGICALALVYGGRPVAEPVSSREWRIIVETASGQPPMDLGEPLDAGNGEARGLIALALDPISIGPVLDAEDDPLAYELGAPSRSPINIGEHD
jgi:hypothetical protein